MKTRTKPKRLLSMLLMLVMVLTLLPATALADDPKTPEYVTEITITGVAVPETGNYCTLEGIKVEPADAVEVKEIYWRDGTKDNNPSETDRFIGGHSYRLIVNLEPKEGYAFEFDTASTDAKKPYKGNVTINGGDVQVARESEAGGTGLYISGWPTVPELGTGPSEISQVFVSEIDGPMEGGTPDYEASLPASDDRYRFATAEDLLALPSWNEDMVSRYKNGMTWESWNTFETVYPTDKLVEGENYRVEIALVPKDGYMFTSGTNVMVNDEVVGSKAIRRENEVLFVLFGMGAPFAETGTDIYSLNVSSVESPIVGQPCRTDGMSATAYPDKNSAVADVFWYDYTDLARREQTDVFVSGHEYALHAEFIHNPGYSFESELSKLREASTINGIPGSVKNASKLANTRASICSQRVEPLEPITKLTITGVPEPIIDQPCTTEGITIATEPVGVYELQDVYWRDEKSGFRMEAGDVFEKGHSYRCYFEMQANPGYTFDSFLSEMTINGEQRGYMYRPDPYTELGVDTVWRVNTNEEAAMVSGARISSIDISDFTRPATYHVPDYNVTLPADGKYRFATADDLRTAGWDKEEISQFTNGIKWIGRGSGLLNPTDPIKGEDIRGEIKFALVPESGFEFDVQMDFTLNGEGENCTMSLNTDKSVCTITYRYYGMESYRIGGSDISGITFPEPGKTPDFVGRLSLYAPGECHLASKEELEELGFSDVAKNENGIWWFNSSTGSMASQDVFVENEKYYFSVVLIPNHESYFAKDAVGLINDEKDLVKSVETGLNGSYLKITSVEMLALTPIFSTAIGSTYDLDVYSEPTTSSTKLGSLEYNAVIRVLEKIEDPSAEWNNWYKIIYGTEIGYIKVEKTDGEPSAATIQVSSVTVRSDPNDMGSRIGGLVKGQDVILLDLIDKDGDPSTYEWAKIIYDNRAGFIVADSLGSFGVGGGEPEYGIISGDDQTYSGSGEVSVKADGDMVYFDHLEMDDVVIKTSDYTVVADDTSVTLKESYMQTLTPGVHKLKFVYSDGSVVATVNVPDASGTVPGTDPGTDPGSGGGTTPPAVEYKFTAGDGGVYTLGSGKTLEFTADGPKDECTGIAVDGYDVDESNYTLVSGSTIITLQNAYLETLSVGDHMITVFYGRAKADAGFKVAAASQDGGGITVTPSAQGQTPDKPASTVKPAAKTAGTKTGDDSRAILWLVLLLAACGVIGVVRFGRNKRTCSK